MEYVIQENLIINFIQVPAHYTSQKCSGCGELVPKSLSVRTHICPYCNLIMSRDQNAALNILKLGRESAFGEDAAIAGLKTREASWSLAKR